MQSPRVNGRSHKVGSAQTRLSGEGILLYIAQRLNRMWIHTSTGTVEDAPINDCHARNIRAIA